MHALGQYQFRVRFAFQLLDGAFIAFNKNLFLKNVKCAFNDLLRIDDFCALIAFDARGALLHFSISPSLSTYRRYIGAAMTVLKQHFHAGDVGAAFRAPPIRREPQQTIRQIHLFTQRLRVKR